MSHCENCARGDTRPTFQEYVDYLTRVLETHPEIANFQVGGASGVTVYSLTEGVGLESHDPKIHYGGTPIEFFSPEDLNARSKRTIAKALLKERLPLATSEGDDGTP